MRKKYQWTSKENGGNGLDRTRFIFPWTKEKSQAIYEFTDSIANDTWRRCKHTNKKTGSSTFQIIIMGKEYLKLKLRETKKIKGLWFKPAQTPVELLTKFLVLWLYIILEITIYNQNTQWIFTECWYYFENTKLSFCLCLHSNGHGGLLVLWGRLQQLGQLGQEAAVGSRGFGEGSPRRWRWDLG